MMRKQTQCHPGRGGLRRGFTMVELLISMTVGLLLLAGMLSVLLSSSSTGKTRDRASAVQFSGRYALDVMKRDIQHAGFLGVTSLFSPDEPISITVSNVCDATAIGRMSTRLWGGETNPYAGTCIPAANYLGGDVIVVRHLSANTVAAPFSSTLIYYHSAYEGGQAFKGPTAPDFTGSARQLPYLDYLLQESVYYLSPYTTSSTESPRVPALWRLTLGNGPAMVPELVASGVEQMQIRYGQFNSDGTGSYIPASSVSDWDSVIAVEIALLVRADTADPGYQNTTTYTLAGNDFTVNDGYRRMIFTTVVQMRN